MQNIAAQMTQNDPLPISKCQTTHNNTKGPTIPHQDKYILTKILMYSMFMHFLKKMYE